MYFSRLSESKSSGGKAVGVMMLPGVGTPSRAWSGAWPWSRTGKMLQVVEGRSFGV